jgi:hypothetical protein
VKRLLAEVRAASAADLHYLALFGALALPDICGALASDNGRSSGPKFKDWLRANVPEQAGQADEIYGLRCSLLHQGRATPHGTTIPVAFTGSSGRLHDLSMDVDGVRVAWLASDVFVEEVASGVERWLAQSGQTKTVQRNREAFARLRPNGLPPYVVGRPVIARPPLPRERFM